MMASLLFALLAYPGAPEWWLLLVVVALLLAIRVLGGRLDNR